MARVMRVRPPRPAAVPVSGARRRAASRLAWTLAAALLLATTLAYAGGTGRGASDDPGTHPTDPGLAAVETALLLVSPAVPSAPAAGGTRPLGVLQTRQALPGPTRAKRGPRRAPPVRLGRAQRWYARRLLEGG
jgi:hypothetical protein